MRIGITHRSVLSRSRSPAHAGTDWHSSGRVYHKDGEFYGKTKRGKFVTEEDARKEGFHEAQRPATAKKTIPKQGDQSGLDSTKDTHSSTPPKP